MIFSSLRVTSFRNLKDDFIKTEAKNIFIIGNNGQGKTNFLEALYYCAYASSFRRNADSEIVKTGDNDFSAYITFSQKFNEENNFSNILVKFENGKKQILLNGNKINDRKELLYTAPCIVFCHDDLEFVSGSQERRRWFFDQTLSLYDPLYLDDLRSYKRIIKSRNNVLRENLNTHTLLDTLDQQCAFYGLKIMEKRRQAAGFFSEIFSDLYREVTKTAGLTVQYFPSWKNKDEEEILEYLQKQRSRDIACGISLTGPHRDRYSYSLEGNEYTTKASTGQRRILALLLRVAQASHLVKINGKKPILLLDDVLLEMDGEKRRRFLSVLPEYDQAFFTFLPEEPFLDYKMNDTLVYYVKDGKIYEESG